MKFYTQYLWFETKKEKELVPITDKVEEIVRASGIKEGFVFVSAMHITASVFVNDEESGLHKDIMEWLEKLAPSGQDYAHHHTGRATRMRISSACLQDSRF